MSKISKIVFVQFARIFMAVYTLILGSGCSQPLLEKLMLQRLHSVNSLALHDRISKIKLGPEVLEGETGLEDVEDSAENDSLKSLKEVGDHQLSDALELDLHLYTYQFFQFLLESHKVVISPAYHSSKSISGLPPLYDFQCSWKIYDIV